tara:strand:- start:1388 stop:1540 length:153 start_codon:yes stop_codon:yes gene_type:complete
MTDKICQKCEGEGYIEREEAVPEDFNNDHGYIQGFRTECEDCNGWGYVED